MKTLQEQAEDLEWGPTILAPESIEDVLQWAIPLIGSSTKLHSLGEAYAMKYLLWLKEKLSVPQADCKSES